MVILLFQVNGQVMAVVFIINKIKTSHGPLLFYYRYIGGQALRLTSKMVERSEIVLVS